MRTAVGCHLEGQGMAPKVYCLQVKCLTPAVVHVVAHFMSALILGGSSQRRLGPESVSPATGSVPIPFWSQVELDVTCSLGSRAVEQSRLSPLSKPPPLALVDDLKKKKKSIYFVQQANLNFPKEFFEK